MPARTVGRVQTRAAFRQLQRSQSRASCGPVRASFVAADDQLGGVYPQVGYAIGKHCGNAVVRNTIRRRARETARGLASELPRGTFLLRFEPAAAWATSADLSRCISQALLRSSQATHLVNA